MPDPAPQPKRLEARRHLVRENLSPASRQFNDSDEKKGGFATISLLRGGLLKPKDLAVLLIAVRSLKFLRQPGATQGQPCEILFESLPEAIQGRIEQVIYSKEMFEAVKLICKKNELELVPRRVMRFSEGQGIHMRYTGSRYPATQARLFIHLDNECDGGLFTTFGPIFPASIGYGFKTENELCRGKANRGDITLVRKGIWYQIEPVKGGTKDILEIEIKISTPCDDFS